MGACRNLLRHYGVKNRRTTREVLVNAGRRLVCRYCNQSRMRQRVGQSIQGGPCPHPLRSPFPRVAPWPGLKRGATAHDGRGRPDPQ